MRKRVGSRLRTERATLRAELPRLHAFHRLLDAIPTDLHRCRLDATQTLALPDDIRDRFSRALDDLFAAHPDD